MRAMKTVFYFIIISFLLISMGCENQKEISSINPVNWDKRAVKYNLNDSLINGSTYLSVYSEIYSETEHATINLTATVSLRNINKRDKKISVLSNSKKALNLSMNKPPFVFAGLKAPTIEKIKPKPAISKIVAINIQPESINKDLF